MVCATLLACAKEPDYQRLFSLRTSQGFAGALQAAQERLEANPDDGTAWATAALVYANGGDYLGMGSEAGELEEHALLRAMELSPHSPFTRAAFGLVRRSTDPGEAELQLRRCIDDTPEFLECHNVYGDLLRKAGRPADAENVYLNALTRWPSDGELRISYALQLQEVGEAERGLEMLRTLVSEQPDFARGHWHLATMLYETEGDRAGARRAAIRALELDPLIWNGERFLSLLGEAG
jgi:tetratricopeptide (TPR) repeat protein